MVEYDQDVWLGRAVILDVVFSFLGARYTIPQKDKCFQAYTTRIITMQITVS